MKARIIDSTALASVTPRALRSFALFEGWKQVGEYKSTSQIYIREREGKSSEIVVPVSQSIADYPTIVAQLILAFAEATEKSELMVFRDLTHAERDVIRVRAPSSEEDNSIGVNAGVDIVTEARNMLAASACSAKERRPSFHVGKIMQANEYMSRVRLGQTEPGSFVVTLLAPVPPGMGFGQQTSLWPDLQLEPYDRQVTRLLASGLHATADALAGLNRGRDFSIFEEAVPAGVSANLLDAIASVAELGQGADLSITWARTRPAPLSQDKVFFAKSDAEPLREVARQFRLREPQMGVRLMGSIINLHRGERQEGGRITFAALVDERSRSVSVQLPKPDYEVAVGAHRRRKPILVTGDLVRDGQRWHLRNPTALQVLGSED
jgi:hypothetical protein